MVGGEPVPGHLAGIHDVRQAGKDRVGEPMAAQIVPNPFDRIELRAVILPLNRGQQWARSRPPAVQSIVPFGTVAC